MDLFDPEALLPEQYFTEYSRHSATSSERCLMLAVLCEAVECYQKYAFARDPRGRAIFADAAAWIESNEREWLFSFESICDVLGLDPTTVRRGLSKRRRQKTPIARRPPRIVPLFERRLTEQNGTH